MVSRDTSVLVPLKTIRIAGRMVSLDEQFTQNLENLRRIARKLLKQDRPGTEMEVDELVHETYLIFAAKKGLEVQSERHFRALSARIMQRYLIDSIRHHHTQKNGGGLFHCPLEDAEPCATTSQPSMQLTLHQGLSALGRNEAYRVVVMRAQAGFTIEETANLLNIPLIRVNRLWRRGCKSLRRSYAAYRPNQTPITRQTVHAAEKR
ncbi:ECF-type sigma factor [Acanthopleuribacter pedis]|uniref:RNA polymerase sigma-70 ECF-like HTH domain-containing protein n=1 Tax=Acanthopleuribacter pedis TaxID=442870 RepID=A0A8J7Q131_9BACT|nr:ECF-type sigma factor [Acanthopleuribacter pedis]MBO1317265.1 hypothetical protein [Acanthopleuribacter pedis]MBO1318572.1 hypothetical protein [Acanthopleuribacter pedis]